MLNVGGVHVHQPGQRAGAVQFRAVQPELADGSVFERLHCQL
jgi:hypothetical protein